MYNILLSCLHVMAFFFISGHHGHVVFGAMPTPPPKPSITATPTALPSPSVTPVSSPTDTPSSTPNPEPTAIATPSPTVLPTVTPTMTPEPTMTPSPTASPTPTPEVTEPVASPTATTTPTPSPSPTPTVTPEVTVTPSPTPTEVITPTDTPTPTPTPVITIGNDISYPQCGKTFPSGQGFGIVGVNGGIATTSNPCLSTQLLWASQSLGSPNQTKIQLYVNTGNPGGLNTASWPHDNTDPVGTVTANPYGTCDGADSLACAWQYGWNRAVDDVEHKFIPAANAVSIASDPSLYPWWLDVETVNSWKEGSAEGYHGNRAVLEAMVSYFTSRGITIGIYSTSYQWGQIVQSVPGESNLNGLRNWRAGGGDLAGAQSICGVAPLTPGGSIVMTQYTSGAFDYDYSCL